MNKRKLIVLRGLPGSGKSTWAFIHYNEYLHYDHSVVLCASDKFFETGVYDPELEEQSHIFVRTQALLAMQTGEHVVIIDDFNVDITDIQFYIHLANIYGYEIEIVRLRQTPWDAAKKNWRNFSLDKCREMWLTLRKQELMLCEGETDVFA